MKNPLEITLSPAELDLVCDTHWILTKHTIIKKVYELFGNSISHLENTIENKKAYLPAEVLATRAKISKGENYRQLPYVMLDYPRYFNREDVFAIRVFFWWGNFFSVTLHLSGVYKEQYLSTLIHSFKELGQADFFVCAHDNPWEHHFDNDNYMPIKDMAVKDLIDILSKNSFIKIARKISLRQWQEAPVFIQATFDELMRVLKTN